MKLVLLVLVSLLLASCGEGGDQGARSKHDSRPHTLQWTDGKGDMWAAKLATDSSLMPNETFVPNEPRPASTNGDIRHVSVTHRPDSLVIKVQYLDLDLEDLKFSMPLRAIVKTNLGVESEISLLWDGTVPESIVTISNDNSGIACKAASESVDAEGETATVRVPRSCLGLPRWVRVYLDSEIDQAKNYEAEPAHLDSAMNAGFPGAKRRDGTVMKRTFSERVYASSPSSPSGRGDTSLLIPDPRGDVVRMGPEGEDFASEGTPAPQQNDGDILSTRVEHTATQLRIRVEFARIIRDPKVRTYRLGADVKTNAGRWEVDDEMQDGPKAQHHPVLYLGEVPVPCDIEHSIDYANRTVTWSIPRTCLGEDPAWVQVSLALVTWQASGAATIDDAHTKGFDDSTTFSRPVFKP